MVSGRERERAFEELFAAHYWAVRAYVLRRAPAAVSEDVVSETFLVAWRCVSGSPAFRAGCTSPSPAAI